MPHLQGLWAQRVSFGTRFDRFFRFELVFWFLSAILVVFVGSISLFGFFVRVIAIFLLFGGLFLYWKKLGPQHVRFLVRTFVRFY